MYELAATGQNQLGPLLLLCLLQYVIACRWTGCTHWKHRVPRAQLWMVSTWSSVHPSTPIILFPRPWQIAFKSRADQYICQCFPLTALNGISGQKGGWISGEMYRCTNAHKPTLKCNSGGKACTDWRSVRACSSVVLWASQNDQPEGRGGDHWECVCV